MLYDDKYDKTEERLLDVIQSLQEYSKDRFIAGLYIRNCTPLDIDIRLAEIRRCLDTVHGETLRLVKLASTFNKDFAVKDNQRFATAEMLFNRLRSSMACIRKNFRRTCPIIRKKTPDPNLRPSVFERSVLSKGCCGRDLYGITSFDDNVQALYYEQQALFANILLSLSICYRVINDEKKIKSDPDLCIERLEDQCRRILDDMEAALKYTQDIPESVIQHMIDEMGIRDYAREYFHKATLDEVIEYALYNAQRKSREGLSDQDFTTIFHDKQKGSDALLLIKYFDKLIPSTRTKMDALKIRLFCNWCGGGTVDNPKQIYYRFLIKRYQGKHTQFPDWHAVIVSKGKKGFDFNTEQEKFNKAANLLLENYRNKQTDVA